MDVKIFNSNSEIILQKRNTHFHLTYFFLRSCHKFNFKEQSKSWSLLQLLPLSLFLHCNSSRVILNYRCTFATCSTSSKIAMQAFHRIASNRGREFATVESWRGRITPRTRSSLDAYLSLSPPSKFKLMVATPWPCLFFATALYSPASPFATLSILSLARWYSFWSSSSDVLNRPPSFTSSVPWYLRSPPTCQIEATAGYWLASRVARSEVHVVLLSLRTLKHRNKKYRNHLDNRTCKFKNVGLTQIIIILFIITHLPKILEDNLFRKSLIQRYFFS